GRHPGSPRRPAPRRPRRCPRQSPPDRNRTPPSCRTFANLKRAAMLHGRLDVRLECRRAALQRLERAMENPLLAPNSLPAFTAIRPEHVEPAVREVLAASRARIDELSAVDQPTFARVVEPLEELHHRISRVWSPVSHLNAVLNSEPLRASYNACLPLLSAYQTDLAQSEPLYRAYEGISKREGPALGPVERRLVEHALRDFRLAGVGLDSERKRRFKAVMLELTQLQAKFEENVLDATNAWSHHVTDAGHLAGLNEIIVELARRRAREKGLEGWLLNLDQPTYVAVVTDAEHQPLRRAVYEA